MGVNRVLSELLARMPELEWQLNKLHSISPSTLPIGLFRQHPQAPTQDYINEIKADISTLSARHLDSRLAYYLAQKIHQKINVLVAVCSRNNQNQLAKESQHFGVTELSTRQQWLESLQLNITQLTEQKEALSKTLKEKENLNNDKALLNLKCELGELEKRLTLAQETFLRATT